MSGFRCFDSTGQTLKLDHLTCLVGPNASGKTAALMALVRLFGETRLQRDVTPGDFHLAPDESLNALPVRALSIECKLVFPQQVSSGTHRVTGVPEMFNQMIVAEPGGAPYCRIRLEAAWTDDKTADGDVEQKLWWILTPSNDSAVIAENRRPVTAADRARVRVVYVPAARDPNQQIKTTTSSSFGRLVRSLTWGGADASVRDALGELKSHVAALAGVRTMNEKMQETWDSLYDGRVASTFAFQSLDDDPGNLLRSLVATFRPGDTGRTLTSGDLSDGLRSLFSLSMSLGLFRVEEMLLAAAETSGFTIESAEGLPVLTVFAIEEPENHLSPHYLGRVALELRTVATGERAQVLISSHSPSTLARIDPESVRYFLGHEQTSTTQVTAIALPSNDTEALKYVREAVRGFPELYFSRLIIFGEGPSEEIILRHLFTASGAPLDTLFISVVPLGGRHVNHFWRLAHELGIPHLTLLDLDREKFGAGWGRIQYVRDQLVARHADHPEQARFTNSRDEAIDLTDSEWDTLGARDVTDVADMAIWIEGLERAFGVFFSTPLDLDFGMLGAFPTTYKNLAEYGGPRLPQISRNETLPHGLGCSQVLGCDDASCGSTYDAGEYELFAWYKYLFVDGSKPTNHMRALLAIPHDTLVAQVRPELTRLIARARSLTELAVAV